MFDHWLSFVIGFGGVLVIVTVMYRLLPAQRIVRRGREMSDDTVVLRHMDMDPHARWTGYDLKQTTGLSLRRLGGSLLRLKACGAVTKVQQGRTVRYLRNSSVREEES